MTDIVNKLRSALRYDPDTGAFFWVSDTAMLNPSRERERA